MKKLALVVLIISFIPLFVFGQNYGNEPYLPVTNWKIVNHEKSKEVNFLNLLNDYKLVIISKNTNIKELENTGLNGAALGYLLEHQNLIPTEWRNKIIVFTGTLYEESGKDLLYLNLYYFDNEWTWSKTYASDMLGDSFQIVKK